MLLLANCIGNRPAQTIIDTPTKQCMKNSICPVTAVIIFVILNQQFPVCWNLKEMILFPKILVDALRSIIIDIQVLMNKSNNIIFLAASTKLFIPSATITGTNTFTDNNASANVLSNIFADGAVLKIFGHGENGGSGAAANHTYHLIVTAGNNDVVVTDVTLTNEATKSYKIEAYPARTAISVTTPGTETVNEFRYFGERGHRFPNLTLETITNVTKVILYLADE